MINLTHIIFILNFVFTVVLYVTRWTKQDPTYIIFNNFKLTEFNIYLHTLIFTIQLKFGFHYYILYDEMNKTISLPYILNKILNQLNLLYIWMFIFAKDQELWTCELMCRIMNYDHSVWQKNIFKFIYYFMIIFL
jgi:hypothetical protein